MLLVLVLARSLSAETVIIEKFEPMGTPPEPALEKMIEQFDRVPRRQNEERVYVTAPEYFPKGETIEVYYPITDFHESSNLATVLIVFGSGEQFSVATLPTTSLERLAFDEKQHLFPGWQPTKPAGGGTAAPIPGLTLEIRRIRREPVGYRVFWLYLLATAPCWPWYLLFKSGWP